MLSIVTLICEFLLKSAFKEINNTGVTELIDLLFILFFSVAFIFEISKSKKLGSLSVPLFLGYLLRISLLLFDRYGQAIYKLPNSGADSEMYYHNACNYSWHGSYLNEGFIRFMGRVFTIIGTSRLYGQFIVVLFSVVSLILFALLLIKLDISSTTRYKIYKVVCLLPNLTILSSIFLRESIVAMFITISFYIFYKWLIGGNVFYFVLAFASAFYASSFHSGSAAVAIGYIAIVLLYDRKNRVFRFKAKNIIPSILLLAVVAFLFINYSGNLFGKMQNLESISDVANTSTAGGSSYAKFVGNSSNPISMIIFTPLRILFFLGSPFPFQWRGISDIIAFCFSSLFFIYAVWCDIKFLKSGELKNRTLVIALTIVAASTVFVFAWGVSNTGTACRHRDKITIIWGLILALTYNPYHSKSINDKGENNYE